MGRLEVFPKFSLILISVVPQIYKLCHIFRELIGYIFIVVLSCIMFARNEHVVYLTRLLLDQPL
jgi:hypothetical protein